MNSLIGIDLGSYSIKAVEIISDKNELRMENLFLKDIPQEFIAENKKDKIADFRREALREIISKRITESKVSISLPYDMVMMERLSVTSAPRDELNSIMKWEMADKFKFPVNNAKIDYILLDKAGDLQGNRLNVLGLAVLKEEANKMINEIQNFGAEVVSLQPSNIGIVNLLIEQNSIKEDEVVGILDLGANQSSFSVVFQGNIHFYRNLTVNGSMITKAISDYCDFAPTDAEKAKKRIGLVTKANYSEDKSLYVTLGIEKQSVYAATTQLERLVSDVERSFKYLSFKLSSSKIQKLNKIILLGGGANLRGLVDFIASRLYVPVEVINPFKKLVYVIQRFDADYLKQIGASVANSIGACSMLETGE